MTTHAVDARARRSFGLPEAALRQIRWLAGGLALGFSVPFVFADRLGLPRDLYYAVFIVAVAGFFAAWAHAADKPIGEMIRRRWPAALVLGLACATALALLVLHTAEATARPDGLALAGAVAWRGVLYGAADGLLLSAFPILAVFAAFEGTRFRGRILGKALIGLAALAASLTMTATYHLGYSDFRSAKVQEPLKGDVIWSIPTLLTLNPIGAPIAHAGMHVTAVLHSYETDLFLPPHG